MEKVNVSKDAIWQLKKEGIITLDIPALSSAQLEKGFSNFLKEPEAYKQQFLQRHFNFGFDGYSYQGQKDSSNQGDDDLLDTFVFSDLRAASEFPEAFQVYFKQGWLATLNSIKTIEQALASGLGLKIETQNLAHMVSCNYYPPTKMFATTARENTRLSSHPDVSLFTIFPFGVKEGFSYQNPNGDWVELAANSKWTVFPGYLLEATSNGKIKALNHRVVLPENRNEERFSFAFFSLPRQQTHWRFFNSMVTAEDYFEKYLSLF